MRKDFYFIMEKEKKQNIYNAPNTNEKMLTPILQWLSKTARTLESYVVSGGQILTKIVFNSDYSGSVVDAEVLWSLVLSQDSVQKSALKQAKTRKKCHLWKYHATK